jgi:hypothetical protein
MEKMNRGILMAAPALAVAFMLTLALPGTALLGTQPTTDSVGPHGYVVVTVTRDGNEVYRHEDHNLITNAGKDFISVQIGQTTGIGSNGANFIALSNSTSAPAAGDTTLAGEITTGGLARSQGAYAHTNGQTTYTITEQFSATATHTAVQKAGLFTAASSGTMMAENTFSSVTLQNGDQLTITWTITLS